MPSMPYTGSLNARSVGIINAIRNNASMEYYQAVPAAVDTTESIRAVGQAITSFQPRMNEFISALVNRIARVVVTSRMYTNPWAFAKKGVLEFGETIEEIFVDIANAHPFDPEDAASTVFQRNKPNLNTMFHAMNLQTQYPVTISQEQLRQAFTSLNGVTDLIARIVNSLYSAANYDEFIMMKYVISQVALAGGLANSYAAAAVDETTAKAVIKNIKAASTKFGFMSTQYTTAGNRNFCEKDSIYAITTADFDALTDVDVLAKAFNIERANWAGRHVTVDSFAFNEGELDRLDQLLADDPTYKTAMLTNSGHGISTTENTALGTIQAIIMDEQWLQVYDVLNQFTEIYNPKGLYWNEFYHVWRIYSASPFVNALMFTSTQPALTSLTASGPTSVTTGSAVTRKQYSVTAFNGASAFLNKGIEWSVAKTTGQTGQTGEATVDEYGLVTFSADCTGKWTVTAKSVAVPSVTASVNVTVAAS